MSDKQVETFDETYRNNLKEYTKKAFGPEFTPDIDINKYMTFVILLLKDLINENKFSGLTV